MCRKGSSPVAKRDILLNRQLVTFGGGSREGHLILCPSISKDGHIEIAVTQWNSSASWTTAALCKWE
ncbi:hypothetical protein RvY_05682 [Ramazzottius varieornatus]|uniref:Uncharacterized protein n=1 Tax=Ramazzottius varieornatus TaxID=947166 RepID=A0A1D1V5M2_RAMVA|nr:hypothetical protein RvY_05682 [Ramazzottius varieornatus]